MFCTRMSLMKAVIAVVCLIATKVQISAAIKITEVSFRECSSLRSESVPLPMGCTINGGTTVDRFFCDLSACSSCSLDSSCCCRQINDEEIHAECNGDMTFSVQNATHCGCTSCNDVDATVQVTVLSARNNTPIPAAQILRVDKMKTQLLGITLNNGQFVFQEPLRTQSMTINIRASDFLAQTRKISLQPGHRLLTITIFLNPLVVSQIGMGGSVVTVHLGRATISAPAKSFHTMNAPRQVYKDLITFRGVVMDSQDNDNLAGLPTTSFEYFTGNGMKQFATSVVTFITFEDVNGAPLMVNGLSMNISLPNDGTLPANDIFLVIYNETTDTWSRKSDFQVINIPGVQKRQTVRVVEGENIPVGVFAAVAMDVNANCWIQARTFDVSDDPFSGTFVRLEQTSTINGNAFMYRFGTNTGSTQTALSGLVSNALCLPLACNSFTIAVVEAREGFVTTNTSLIPEDFPADTFTAMEDAPIVNGSMFTVESVILQNNSNRSLPFYNSESECVANGRENTAQADVREYFRFRSESTDIDECELNPPPCDVNANCTNTIGSFTCECNIGYTGDGMLCTDIDECELNPPPCDVNANCTNTIGSFTCECNYGYTGDGMLCTGIPPIVELIPANGNDAYTVNPGREFSMTCQSTGEFSGEVQWVQANGSPVPDLGTVVRGSEITVEANGMLFSTNQSNNVSVLTTVNGFGLSSLAVVGYSCFANNSFNTTRTNITLVFTDLHPISFTFLRFSTTPLDELQQMLGLPSLQLLFAFIHTAFLRVFDENLPANQQAQTVNCRNVTRRLEDQNLDRVECNITFNSTTVPEINPTLTEAGLEESQVPVNSTPILSVNGFCNFNMTSNNRGQYNWTETFAGNSIVLPCTFGGESMEPTATRFCSGSQQDWEAPVLTMCFTEVTSNIQRIGMVTISMENAQGVVNNLIMNIEQGNEEDQITVNVGVITNVIESTRDIVETTNISLPSLINITMNVVQIIDNVTRWPVDLTNENASRIIDAFEDIVNVILQDTRFNLDTPLLVEEEDVALRAERIAQDDLEQTGRTFGVSTSEDSPDGRGNWTTAGCELRGESNTVATCQCNHLTNFAILVDICTRSGDCESSIDQVFLEVISYVGTSLSLFGLTVTIITLLVFKKLRQRDASKFHIQLCLALLYMLIVFVVGIDKTKLYGGCLTVSVLIHYFGLVSVMWMGAEAVLMFRKLVIVFGQTTTRFIVAVSLVCWLVPIIPVVIPLAIDLSDFSDDLVIQRPTRENNGRGFCFLSNTAAFFSAFLGPVFIIILFNLVIFVIVIIVLIKHAQRKLTSKDQANRQTVIRRFISIIGVMALYGLTWLLGAFTIQGASETFQILFTIFTSLQGFFIFLFFCVFGREARELWLQVLCCGKKIPEKIPGTTPLTQPIVKRKIQTTIQRPSQPSVMTSGLRSDPPTSNLNMASLSSSSCLQSSVFGKSEATQVCTTTLSEEILMIEANPMAFQLEALEERSQIDDLQFIKSKIRESSFSHSSAEESDVVTDEQHQHDNRSSQPTAEVSALHLPVLVRRSSTTHHHIETAQLRFNDDEDDSDSEVIANPNAEV